MSLYSNNDQKYLEDHIEEIKTAAELKAKQLMGSMTAQEKLDHLNRAAKLVLDYVRDNKRKLYGGFALHHIMKLNGDQIYDDSVAPDIDFYSPDPLRDVKAVTDILYDNGFDAIAEEALHEETYKIKVGRDALVDVSYVPKNIYNTMPFLKTDDDINLIGPHFMIIDYFRMFTDFTSYWRLVEKHAMERFIKIQKYYPFPSPKRALSVNRDMKDNTYTNVMDAVQAFCVNRNSAIVVGYYAYNHYLYESGILKQKGGGKRYTHGGSFNYRLLNVPYYELVSSNYVEDAKTLINQLKETYQNITHEEHYPYFQLTDYSVRIKHNNKLICVIYGNNHRCHPFETVRNINFDDSNDIQSHDGEIQIGSYLTCMMYALIVHFQARTDNNRDLKDDAMTYVSHMTDIRNVYLTRTNKTVFDDTIFRDFSMECVGKPIDLFIEQRARFDQRKKAGKPLIWRYRPADGKRDAPEYRFANSSGNHVNNPKNYKLTDKHVSDSSDSEHDDKHNEPDKLITMMGPADMAGDSE